MAACGVLDAVCVREWLTDGQLDKLKYPSNRLANETKSFSTYSPSIFKQSN